MAEFVYTDVDSKILAKLAEKMKPALIALAQE